MVVTGSSLPAVETVRIAPDAEGVFDAVARIGYELEQAVADLVDNSVDADAREVLVRLFVDDDAVRSVAVIDDGHGMTAAELERAMAFGARGSKGDRHLGKYGMGLKAASFSQSRDLTVLTRRDGLLVGRRWVPEGIREDWLCETVDTASADRFLQRNADRIDTSRHGTMVLWERLDRLGHALEPAERTVENVFRTLSAHLGLVFHRMIEEGRVRLRLDARHGDRRSAGLSQTVKPLNPFPIRSGHPDYPVSFAVDVAGLGTLPFEAHIWRRDATDAGFRLGGGTLANRQGFYVYRNGRLIQAGGWNGLRSDTEVHSSLARVRVDLPASADDLFKLSVQKSTVSVPEHVLTAVRRARAEDRDFGDFLADAEAVYRSQTRRTGAREGLVPRRGITRQLGARFEQVLGHPDGDEGYVDFAWARLPDDTFFAVDPNENLITLNERYRPQVLYGNRGSAGDAPLVKTLLMLLCKDDMRRVNRVRKHDARLRTFNRLLVEAVRAQW